MNGDSKIDILDVRLLLQSYINKDPLVEITKKESTIYLENGGINWSTSKTGANYTIPLKKIVFNAKDILHIWYRYEGDGKLSVKSSDTSVATVSKSTTGENYYIINTIKPGAITITFSLSEGTNYQANSIEIPFVCMGELQFKCDREINDKNTIFIIKGTKANIALDNKPQSSTVTWKSKNTAVATIDKSGVLTAVNFGQTSITATCEGITKTLNVVVLNSYSIIDVRNQSFYTYMSQLYTGNLNGNFQNFGFVALQDPVNEHFFVTNKYTGNGGAEQVRVKVCVTSNDRVSHYTPGVFQNVSGYTAVLDLNYYYSHGQAFDIQKTPNRDFWLLFITAATEPGGTQYLRVFPVWDGTDNPFRAGRTAWKEFPDLKGQPSIDIENDLIAMVNGTTCKVYKYSDLINENKVTKLYEFKFERSSRDGGEYYTNGFAIKNGFLYEIRGADGDNAIEVWDFSGAKRIYRKLQLLPDNVHEPQGIHIYENRIFIGITNYGNPYANRQWSYTVGYLE